MMCEFDVLHCCSCCLVAYDEKRLPKLSEHTASVLMRIHLLAQIDTSAESSTNRENTEGCRSRETDRGDGRADRRLQQQIERQPRSARETDRAMEIDL